jgi:hypothetical protein
MVPGDFARVRVDYDGMGPTLWRTDEVSGDDEVALLSEDDLVLIISRECDEFYAFVLFNGLLGYVPVFRIERIG